VLWLAEVRRWIEQHVTVTGEIEQPHVRAWATALRVPTPDGVVWFKAAREAFAYEARVLEVLTPLAPELLPEVVAARSEVGWLLLRDAGARARESPIDWKPLMRRYAELQMASVPLVPALLRAGILDHPAPRHETLLPYLGPAVAERLGARLPEVEERLGRLAASPLPIALDHADLHDANVFSRDGHVRILDWGDSAVAHPFLTLSVGMEPEVVAAYLEPWEKLAPRERLLADAEDVIALRHVLRPLSEPRVVALDPKVASWIEEQVVMFLGAGAS
jgi:hypothetical protein